MPPPTRATNYGPNMHQGGPFPVQGALQHMIDTQGRDRFPPNQQQAALYNTQLQQFQQAQQQAHAQAQRQAAGRTPQQQIDASQNPLMNVLKPGFPGGGGMNGIGGAVSAAGLGGQVHNAQATHAVSGPERGQAGLRCVAGQASANGENACIRDVWAGNLVEEFQKLWEVIPHYPYIAMDTEFPGIVARPVGKFVSKADYHYQTLRVNVDMLKMIQLGLTFCDESGEVAKVDGVVSTWQFNFKFDLSDDMYSGDSINLLKGSGIDFEKHCSEGIDVQEFGYHLIDSGMVMLDSITWISFHSGYDFGYLVKVMSGLELPREEQDFREMLKCYFPLLYDVKFLMKSTRTLKGGLQEIADDMGIARVGPQHQAGSDSLLTGNIFFAMRQRYFGGQIDDAKFLGQVWGLNTNSPIPAPAGPAPPQQQPPQPPRTPVANGTASNANHMTPERRVGTPSGRMGTPNTPSYHPTASPGYRM